MQRGLAMWVLLSVGALLPACACNVTPYDACYIALAEGPMSVVSPLTAVIVAGIPVMVGVIIGERPSVISYGGIALAIVVLMRSGGVLVVAAGEEFEAGQLLQLAMHRDGQPESCQRQHGHGSEPLHVR